MARSIVLELVVSCGSCGAAVPVPTIGAAASCERCRASNPLPAELWTGVFPPGASAEIVRRLARGGVEYRPQDPRAVRAVWIRRSPFCPGCGRELEETTILSRLAAGRFPCPGCGRRLAVRAADELTRAIQPDAIAVLSQHVEEEPTTHRTAAIPSCLSCGAPLLADGSSRSVVCRKCSSTNVLPEEVWAQFHPVEIPRPFFLICTHGLAPAELAGRPDLTSEQLGALAFSADPEVRWAVAANPAVSAELLGRLAADASGPVRERVAGHPGTPARVLARWRGSGGPGSPYGRSAFGHGGGDARSPGPRPGRVRPAGGRGESRDARGGARRVAAGWRGELAHRPV